MSIVIKLYKLNMNRQIMQIRNVTLENFLTFILHTTFYHNITNSLSF